EFLSRQLASNQFFSGGLILMVSGAALALARHIPGKIWAWLKDRCLTEIDVPDREAAFEWLDKWLAAHVYSQRRARRLTVRVQPLDHRQRAADPAGDHRPRLLFAPAPGEHWLWYRGRLVILNRQRADTEKNAQGQAPISIRETFSITIVSRNRQLAWQLLEDAREHALPRNDRRLTIYHVTYGSWSEQMQRLPRPPESVVLRAGQMEDLIADARRFLDGREWYVQRGIPYRRGYLLHGPPGSGKSSAVVGIATALGMDVAVLNLSSFSLDDNELADRLAAVPPNAIVLIEDIDCAFVARKSSEEKTSRITFSGLLNAIDGVAAGEGRLLFATTNHPERLDPALIRPGRIDRRVEIGHADREQLARIFRRFFPGANPDLAEQFAAALPERQLAMSGVQAYLIQHSSSAEQALAHVGSLYAVSAVPLGCALRAAADDPSGGTWRLRELEAFTRG
ncbi:MAG TPA: AAA family ATPase, partial [Pirellulaceae bacterium]|nr:AAA family ATPase [Pirellulaceae bacterium]